MVRRYLMQIKKLLIPFIVLMTLMTACTLDDTGPIKENANEEIEEIDIIGDVEDWNIEDSILNGLPIVDNILLYDDYETTRGESSANTVLNKENAESLYVTILPSYDEMGNTISFNDLNKIRDFNLEAPILDVYFQEGDSGGPNKDLMEFNAVTANGKITLRGHSTRKAKQKSYKIKLSDNAELWHDQNVLNLNKSPYDPTRILNAFAFDLLEEIPNLPSIRTRFVKLYVKDLTPGSTTDEFVDYGYYTHLEQINRRYLQAHGLDRSGSVYKVENYEFQLSDALKNIDEEGYDEKAFSALLEHKTGSDHSKLLSMIKDVNNLSIPIEDVISKHFNEDNYLTWLSFNILVGNYDTQTQNYFLYSPQNALTWYFIPWDYDGAFSNDNVSNRMEEGLYQGKRHHGISQYWNTMLHKRYFKYPENVEKLSKKIEEVYEYLEEEDMERNLDKYESYFKTVVTTMPDFRYIEDNLSDLLNEYSNLKYVPKNNRDLYYQELESPMPFWAGEIRLEPKKYEFRWDNSYDLQADEIRYKIEIATNPFINKPVFVKEDLQVNMLEVELDNYGIYYWRVTAVDAKGNIQHGYDVFVDEDGNIHQGVRKLIVNK